MTDVCEKYYLTDDDWDVLPAKLNTPKAGVALCKFQNRYLYAFGGDNGRSKGNIVSEIEKLDLIEEEEVERWEMLYIRTKEVSSPFSYAAAVLIEDEKILIVGGKQNIVSSAKTYIYDGEEDTLKPFQKGKQPLVDKDHFMQSSGLQYARVFDQLFIMGTSYIHCYSFDLNKWITAGESYAKPTTVL